jgi:hypothetical protein
LANAPNSRTSSFACALFGQAEQKMNSQDIRTAIIIAKSMFWEQNVLGFCGNALSFAANKIALR